MLPISVLLLVSLGLSSAAEYNDLKCWRNKIPQNVDRLEGTHAALDKQNYKKRADAISKCHVAAQDGGYDFFAVGNKGQCWAGHGDEYQKHGKEEKCPENGKGLYGIMNVYEMVKVAPTTESHEVHYESLGCWGDSYSRAIGTLEGKHELLDGNYKDRENALEKCGQAAESLGYTVFAVQNGGYCSAAADAESTYKKYGESSGCEDDGEGGGWANHVYKIVPGPAPAQPKGDVCGEDHCDQDTEYCTSFLGWINPTCKAKLGPKQSCSEHIECLSNSCKFTWSSFSHKCQ